MNLVMISFGYSVENAVEILWENCRFAMPKDWYMTISDSVSVNPFEIMKNMLWLW